MEKPVTVLPEPDSPTRPSTLPRWMEKETSSTAFTTPPRVKKCVRRLRTSSVGVAMRHFFSRGFSTSRSWSPTRLIETMVISSAMPG